MSIPTRTARTPLVSASVATYVDASLAPATRRAYASAIRNFKAWCRAEHRKDIPCSPETISCYVSSLADMGRKPSTISQRVAAIKWAHGAAGYASPTGSPGVRATVRGIRRTLGVAPTRKSAATVERLRLMVEAIDDTTRKGARDRALLLFGFASALRRSELVGLDHEDLELTDRGLLIQLRRSKTDQQGEGQLRAVPFGRTLCPVQALAAWLEAAKITSGALFRSVSRHGAVGSRLSPSAVATTVKSYAQLAGLDPAEFGGHSLRSGLVTSAASNGATTSAIMAHSGHRSEQVLRGYIRRVSAFDDHPVDGLL